MASHYFSSPVASSIGACSSSSPTTSPRSSSNKSPSPKRTLSVRAGPSSKPRHTRGEYVDPEDVLLDFVPCASASHFFPPANPSALLLDPTFRIFYEDFIAAMLDLYYAKPILIQGILAPTLDLIIQFILAQNTSVQTLGRSSLPSVC